MEVAVGILPRIYAFGVCVPCGGCRFCRQMIARHAKARRASTGIISRELFILAANTSFVVTVVAVSAGSSPASCSLYVSKMMWLLYPIKLATLLDRWRNLLVIRADQSCESIKTSFSGSRYRRVPMSLSSAIIAYSNKQFYCHFH